MKLKTINKLTLVVALSTTAAGCAGLNAQTQSLEPTYSDCRIGDEVRLDEAANALTGKIQAGVCRNFDEAFHNLFAVGLKDPGEENREIMASFIKNAEEQKLVSLKEAQETFSRNFHTSFMALPDTYQTCSSLADKPGLMKSLKQELADKEKAYLHVLNDPEGYKEVYRQYEDVVLVIEAADLACKGQVAGR